MHHYTLSWAGAGGYPKPFDQNNFDFAPFQLIDYEDYRTMRNINTFMSQLRGMIGDEMGTMMNRAPEEERGEEDQGGGWHLIGSNFSPKKLKNLQ